jgi:hypothetical protein
MRLIVIENEEIELPQWLLDVIDTLPAKIDRKDGAALVTRHVFQTTPKTVKSWPLPWECPNGRAIAPPATYLAYALLKARKASTGNARWFRATSQTAADAA